MPIQNDMRKVPRGRHKSENKLIRTSFRCTKDEKYELFRRANVVEMRPSVYMRYTLFQIPEDLLEDIATLKKQIKEIHGILPNLANNINQITRAYHQHKEDEPAAFKVLKSRVKVMGMNTESAARKLHKEVE